MKYGYLDSSKASDPAKSAPLISTDGLKTYIEEFQAFANLTITGELDAQTVEMMGRPRCGVKDIVGHGSKREKRYALQGLLMTTKTHYWSTKKCHLSFCFCKNLRISLESERPDIPCLKIPNRTALNGGGG